MQTFAILLAATAAASMGCHAHTPAPLVRVRLAGAQIPLELVESWLHSAKQDYRFAATRIQPVYLSQQGFEHLAKGECDLACTDRRLTTRELEQFGDRKVRGYRIAFYGYGLYVHPDNPLDSIYAKHLSLLFQKKISDWSELGPGSGPVRLLGPQKATRGGTILVLQSRIWFDDPSWEQFDSDAEIVREVAADPLALGFASIGYDNDDVRYLGLRMNRYAQPVFPSLEEIESEQYGLAKIIYVYTDAEPDENTRRALEYLFGPEAHEKMAGMRVWPIPRERAKVEPAL